MRGRGHVNNDLTGCLLEYGALSDAVSESSENRS